MLNSDVYVRLIGVETRDNFHSRQTMKRSANAVAARQFLLVKLSCLFPPVWKEI